MTKGCGGPNEKVFLICLSDFNGHVGKQIDGFGGVHGGFGIGERNEKVRLLLEFYDDRITMMMIFVFKLNENDIKISIFRYLLAEPGY